MSKKPKQVHCNALGGEFSNNYAVKGEIVLSKMDVTKIVMWYFHMND